jgi:hypothetical protein
VKSWSACGRALHDMARTKRHPIESWTYVRELILLTTRARRPRVSGGNASRPLGRSPSGIDCHARMEKANQRAERDFAVPSAELVRTKRGEGEGVVTLVAALAGPPPAMCSFRLLG